MLPPDIPARQRRQGKRILVCCVAIWAAIALLAPFSAATSGAVKHSKDGALERSPLADEPELDIALLRSEAAGGNGPTVRQLGMALMDHYELTGDTGDLIEAVAWVDFTGQRFGDPVLVARVLAHYCDLRAIRKHALCDLAE